MSHTSDNTSGTQTFTATAVAIAAHMRVKLDSNGLISLAGLGDTIGVTKTAIVASGRGPVQLFSREGTTEFMAAGAITNGALLYAAASGKVDDAINGAYLGYIALEAASADGDVIAAVPVANIRALNGTGGEPALYRTLTAALTTGAQTINKPAGSVNFAAAATTLVVTNSLAIATSLIFVQILTADATALSATVTRAAGSFTITLNAAATAETAVAFLVTN